MKGPKTNDRCSPLPRRTGHGDFPHPALARVVSARKHSQRLEAQVFQVSIQTNTRSCAPAPLAAPLQMLAQAIAHEMIKLPKRLARKAQPKVVGPAAQVSVESLNQFRQRGMTLLPVNLPSQSLPFPVHRFARGFQVPVS